MTAFGFRDVRLTPAGSDAGVDVASWDGFAQVKLEANRTSRPALQQLLQACAKCDGHLLFFSDVGFTAQAFEYAEAHDIAAFEFDFSGLPRPKSRAARDLSCSSAVHQASVPVQAVSPEAPSAPRSAQVRRSSDNLNLHDLPVSWHR